MRKLMTATVLMTVIIGCGRSFVKKEFTKFPEGEKLYMSKCAGCHRFYLPHEFTPAKWDSILVVMRPKAKITLEEEKEILNYLKEELE